MDFKLLKDWGVYKKNDSLILKDQTVIDKAIELGVIGKEKSEEKAKPKKDK